MWSIMFPRKVTTPKLRRNRQIKSVCVKGFSQELELADAPLVSPGDIQDAVNAAVAASAPQKKLAPDSRGRVRIVQVGHPTMSLLWQHMLLKASGRWES